MLQGEVDEAVRRRFGRDALKSKVFKGIGVPWVEADKKDVEAVLSQWGSFEPGDGGLEMLNLRTTELSFEALEQMVEAA
jgi:hypothetical protein